MNPEPTSKPEKSEGEDQKLHAHQPDGTDSSDEFSAGIADENTVPDELPE